MNKWDIGSIVSKEDYTLIAIKCNELGDRYIANSNGAYIVTKSESSEPTLEQQLINLEIKYNMPRVIREGILGNPSAYSEFNVNRARDLEDLAKKVRDLKEGK